MGLEREARCERALGEVDSRWPPSRRYITSSIASVASVVACSTSRAGPPGSRRAAIAASASRRADADVELTPSSATSSCSRAGSPAGSRSWARRRIAAPSARAAGEEEHAAELDRRRGDRGRVLAALDDLRQRRDRLRCAGAGVRLAELEQDGAPVLVSGRLVEGAGE